MLAVDICFFMCVRNWFDLPAAKYNFLIIRLTVWLIEKETEAAQLLAFFF